jgi:RNA polymerase sigma factor (sigma-70 family)
MSPASDFEQTLDLVLRARGGNAVALRDLFERCYPRAVRIASLRMGKRLSEFIDYEDIAQEALAKVFRGLDEFEPRSESSFRSWVALCVEREVRDAERQRTSSRRGGGLVRRFSDIANTTMLSAVFGAGGPTPSQVVSAHESEERLEAALLALKPKYRELLIQRYICGQSFADIARELAVDESTVRQGCRRAEAKLKTALGRD